MRQYLRCAKWRRSLRKLAVLLAFVLSAHFWPVGAATAFAECVDDAPLGRSIPGPVPPAVDLAAGASFLFRVEPVKTWRIDKAVLLLHVASGPIPATLDFGGGRATRPEDKGDGWIAARVPTAVIRKMIGEPGARLTVRLPRSTAKIHLRESPSFAPYLVIEGAALPK
jgi:hypothetical protein